MRFLSGRHGLWFSRLLGIVNALPDMHPRQDCQPQPQLPPRQLPVGQLFLRMGDVFVAELLDRIEPGGEVLSAQAGEALADGGEDPAYIGSLVPGVLEAKRWARYD